MFAGRRTDERELFASAGPLDPVPFATAGALILAGIALGAGYLDDKRSGSGLQFQQISLPRRQKSDASTFVSSNRVEARRGAPIKEGSRPLLILRRRPGDAAALQPLSPFAASDAFLTRRRRSGHADSGSSKALSAASRNPWRRRAEKWRKSGASPAANAWAASSSKWLWRMWKEGRSATCASFSRHSQSSRTIAEVRPSIFPGPGNAPGFFFIAHPLHGRLPEGALAGWRKPFQTAALPANPPPVCPASGRR